MTTFGSLTDDRPTLGSIVGDADHFLRCAFGHSAWRGRSAGAHELFGIDDVDRIVSSAARVPAIRMVREGRRVPPDEFCSPTRIGSVTVAEVADVRKVLDQFRRGATLVLQSLHRTWTPVSAWCAALERELGWPVQANAYLTPAGERGLAPHADRHDVLAIQLHGSKSWEVDELGPLDVQPGDVIYLPAGLRHEAHTEGRPSLHLTVGIHRPAPDRIARAAASLAIERARQPIGTPPATSVGLLRDALGDIDAAEVVERLRRRPRHHEGGLLAAAIARPAITESTEIGARGPWTVGTAGDRVVLEWPAGRLFLPERARSAVDALADRCEPTPVDRLPGLSPDEQVALARRLVDEGAASPVPASDRQATGDSPMTRPWRNTVTGPSSLTAITTADGQS